MCASCKHFVLRVAQDMVVQMDITLATLEFALDTQPRYNSLLR